RLLQSLLESCEPPLYFGITLTKRRENADLSDALLRAHRNRPRGRSAAKQRDELAASHCPMSPVLAMGRIAQTSMRLETVATRDVDPIYGRFGSEAAEMIGTIPRARPLCAESGQTGRHLAMSVLCQKRTIAVVRAKTAYIERTAPWENATSRASAPGLRKT